MEILSKGNTVAYGNNFTYPLSKLFLFSLLMNYIGNDLPDRLERALMTAVAGVVGISLGIFILYKAKDDKPHDDFD